MCLTTGQQSVAAQGASEGNSRASWQLQWANDVIFESDNQFSNGIMLTLHSQASGSLVATHGTPAVGKTLAQYLLPHSDSLYYRQSWSLGHSIQTPEDKSSSELNLSDVPYMGLLGWANTFSAFNDRRYTGFGWLIGWVGEGAQGEALQNASHDIIGAVDPNGWENQLDNELVVNLYYGKRRKVWSADNFDVAVGADAALGSLYTLAEATVEFRIGNFPAGFVDIPTPIGRSIDYYANLRDGEHTYFYGSVAARATRFFHALPRDGNYFRDGNAWTEQNMIDPEDFVGQVIIGAYYQRPKWGANLSLWLSTQTFSAAPPLDGKDLRNSFVAVSFDRYFN